jgi:hypothetical protein
MGFMALVRASKKSEPGIPPDEALTEVWKHNDTLVRAGALLATDGPFLETKELVG